MIGSPKITLGMVLIAASPKITHGNLIARNPVQNAKCQDPALTTWNPMTQTCEKLCEVQGAPQDCDENTGFAKSGSGALQTQFGIGSAALQNDCLAAETLIETHNLFFWNWDIVPGLNCGGKNAALATKLGHVLSGKDESGKKVKAAKFFPMAWGTGGAGGKHTDPLTGKHWVDGVALSAKEGHEVIMGYNEADMHGSNANGITWAFKNRLWAPKCSDSGRNMFDYRDYRTCATEATSAGMFKDMFAPGELLRNDWKQVSDNQHTFYEDSKASASGSWPSDLKPQVWAPAIANACGTAGKSENFANGSVQSASSVCKLPNKPAVFWSAEQYQWWMSGALLPGHPRDQKGHVLPLAGSIFCAPLPKSKGGVAQPNAKAQFFPDQCTRTDNRDFGYFVCEPGNKCLENNPMWLQMFENMNYLSGYKTDPLSGGSADTEHDPFYNIDVLPFHMYPGGADGKAKATAIKNMFAHMLQTWGHKRNLKTNKPITFALTEVAFCGIPADAAKAGMSAVEVAKLKNEAFEFMKDIIPWMFQQPRMSHFAWFSDPSFPSFDLGDNGASKFGGNIMWDSALFKDGALTDLGECYTALTDRYSKSGKPDRVAAACNGDVA